MNLRDRIRGYLPVVIDVETGGFNDKSDALLEICAVIIGFDVNDKFFNKQVIHFHIVPFPNANIDSSAVEFNGIDIDNPFRLAVSEEEALGEIFTIVNNEIENENCSRAILVGHNAFFDLGFIQAATERVKIKSPFHKFSTLDTVSLSALYYGETVLAKAVIKAKLDWDDSQAHSALYDTQKTAELFCHIFNQQKF